MATVEDEAAQLTQLLRSGQDRAWVALRTVFERHGVDPDDSVLAFAVEQGDDAEFAVVVTADGQVVTCAWVPSTASTLEWVPITSWWRDSSYREAVESAWRLRR